MLVNDHVIIMGQNPTVGKSHPESSCRITNEWNSHIPSENGQHVYAQKRLEASLDEVLFHHSPHERERFFISPP